MINRQLIAQLFHYSPFPTLYSNGWGILFLVRLYREFERSNSSLPNLRLQKEVDVMRVKGRGDCRKFLAAGIASAVALCVSMAVQAEDKKHDLNLEANYANVALLELGETAGAQIIIPEEVGKKTWLPAIKGEYNLAEALTFILKDTGLSYEFTTDDTVLVTESGKDIDGKTRRNEVISDSQNSIEEMIVTATKRSQNLQDTAMSISALSGDIIERRGLTSMGDYLNTIPGVTMQDRGAGHNSIVIRGIASDPQKEIEAAGVYFGETPVSGVGPNANAGSLDLKMVDIDRVEVLRGPQGTLYGAGSMGGIVRIIPAKPNVTQTEGAIAAQYSQTGELGGDNNKIQGVFNLPVVADKLALRGVAYRIDNSGYIKNIAGSYSGDHPVLDKVNTYGTADQARDFDEVGSNNTTGLRLTTLWQPNDRLAITLGHTWQEVEQSGLNEVDLTLPGTFQQIALLPGPLAESTSEGHSPGPDGLLQEIHLTHLVVDYDLAWGNLYSSSSWLETDGEYRADISGLEFTLAPYALTSIREHKSFVQELRFASQFEGPLELTAGIYYENRKTDDIASEGFSGDPARAIDAITAMGRAGRPIPADAPAGFMWETINAFATYYQPLKQKAFFGELSYQITDQLTATVGGRHYEYEQEYKILFNGFWFGSLEPFVHTDLALKSGGETYKANLSWTPNDDSLVYLLWSEGYRVGKSNPYISRCDSDNNGIYDFPDGTSIPYREFLEPDTLENFELGYKADMVDGRMTLNAAVYRINWDGLPIELFLPYCTAGTNINAGKSTSEGVELEARFRLMDTLELDVSASYNESTLDGDSSLGNDGDDLPGSADFNFSAGLEYGFHWYGFDAFARIDYAYVSEYDTYINQPDFVPSSGGYQQVHLKTGVTVGQFDINLFVNNLTNDDAITWTESGWGTRGQLRAYRLRPRTMGFNIGYSF